MGGMHGDASPARCLENGGSGVMLLLPFSRARLFFPWRPIYTPPGGVENLIGRAWFLRRSEIPFCVAAAAIGIGGLLARTRRMAASNTSAGN
jgi:hypothetical protein